MKYIIFVVLLVTSHQVLAATDNIDPFADKVLTCREMRVYPQQIFTGGIDLGSGHWSPISVDYKCKESLVSFTFLQYLKKITEVIRSEGTEPCSGSIVSVHWRYYLFRLLRAGFAPDVLLTKEFKEQFPGETQAYFKMWAYQSPANFRLYQTFMAEFNKAQPLLTSYYQKHFRFSHKKARLIASSALMLFMHRAAGSFPGSSWMSNTRPILSPTQFRQLVTSKPIDIPAIKKILKNITYPEHIDDELKAALLVNQPLYLIKLLANQMKSLNHGDESALFFALHNLNYVKWLLKKGAAIDYANGFGKTPLFYVVERSNYQVTNYLLKHGANPNHAYKNAEELKVMDCHYNIQHSKRTPLMHAAQHSTIKMLKLLLKHGAHLKDTDELGFNALDYAIEHRNKANAHFLRSIGVKPNQKQHVN